MKYNEGEIKIVVSSYDKKDFERHTRGLIKELIVDEIFDYSIEVGPYIEKNRNLLIDNSPYSTNKREEKVKKYLFIDVDNSPTVEDCYKIIHYNLPIVSGVYEKNGPEKGLLVCTDLNTGKNITVENKLKGIRQVKCTGMGFTAIDGDVFDKVPKPWFEGHWVTRTHDKRLSFISEDFVFCLKARQAKFNVYADFDMKIKHELRDLEDFSKTYMI